MDKTLNLPPDSIQKIISRVKHLEIRARKLIRDQITSQYHSIFKGKGIEFSDVREYTYGDDVRDIDWNVTARMREPYVKQFVEERQLTVYFVVDVSDSTRYGQTISKRQIMAEIAAFLGFIAYYNQDKVGMILHTTEVEQFVPAKHDYSQLLRIIRDIWYYTPKFRGTSLAHSFEEASSLLKKSAILFLMSDFLDGEYDKALSRLCDRHEVIPLVIHDKSEKNAFHPLLVPWQKSLPLLAFFEDIETGQNETRVVGASHAYDQYKQFYTSVFHHFGLEYLELSSGEDYFKSVEKLLKQMTRVRRQLRN
ncbi:DUF58 domain-containing protein [Thermospira aquatica]|uniref:DUF58 domain-containing protein n=1 Tax=Thermospira aquatica TaxID=2828656 RepID=A0AAX3BFT3_9SPIR|nr:DUF58 domain-containing protein [Thermospira aquatica]URA11035.1 DUF58 domain-containing protein [Thermospira aquatica]